MRIRETPDTRKTSSFWKMNVIFLFSLAIIGLPSVYTVVPVVLWHGMGKNIFFTTVWYIKRFHIISPIEVNQFSLTFVPPSK